MIGAAEAAANLSCEFKIAEKKRQGIQTSKMEKLFLLKKQLILSFQFLQ